MSNDADHVEYDPDTGILLPERVLDEIDDEGAVPLSTRPAKRGYEALREDLETITGGLISTPGLNELCINRPGEVHLEIGGRWESYEVSSTFSDLRRFSNASAVANSQSVNEIHPLLSGQLPDEERVQILVPPAVEPDTISITIRKPSKHIFTFGDFRKQGFFDRVRPISDDLLPIEKELLDLHEGGQIEKFLRLAVSSMQNIVVAGGTSSGKTAFMRACADLIDRDQRLLTIEDTHELMLDEHPNRVHMMYPATATERDTLNAKTLLQASLRMRPDRILLAELRGAAAFDYISVSLSGHGGSMTSLHASSARLAYDRIFLMCQQNEDARAVPGEDLKRLIRSSVDVVVHLHKDAHGDDLLRYISEIDYNPYATRGVEAPSRLTGPVVGS